MLDFYPCSWLDIILSPLRVVTSCKCSPWKYSFIFSRQSILVITAGAVGTSGKIPVVSRNSERNMNQEGPSLWCKWTDELTGYKTANMLRSLRLSSLNNIDEAYRPKFWFWQTKRKRLSFIPSHRIWRKFWLLKTLIENWIAQFLKMFDLTKGQTIPFLNQQANEAPFASFFPSLMCK